ncbi:recombinase family protein [Mesobacillus stamsii]|uniref:DNA invertase Pin-like site-specific DNA recombinase n=1 Tax=Mesobacillus stamsii TaxID=225347 RepID=A0ABU0FW80_9BACI|nr:recombinase family protein [Mesobacillus stamsii]MDQ0414185.1 DNA invertase Pin-like site-specific DNA recombinase [Mesobacillus stamsii]
MTVGIYIRVSTQEQVQEGYSISAQKERLKAYCIAQGWDDFKFYVDEGLSAKDTDRPQLKILLEHIKSDSIKTVLVYKLDRLTRSVLDLYRLLETFDKYNCAFKSATEVYDTTTAMGRMFITIVAALAQWERENLGERVIMGQVEKARQGEYSAKAPYGFDKKDNKLIINEQQSKIILSWIEEIKSGTSIRKLSDMMNNSNVKPIRGYKWHIATMLDILHNQALYGALKWRDEVIEQTHAGIITKEEFNNIQHILKSRQNLKIRETNSIFIFQMKLKCPTCGNRLTCERSSYFRKRDLAQVERNYYRCQACALNKRQAFGVSEIKVEKALLAYMDGLIFENEYHEPKEKNNDLINKFEQQINTVKRQREKFQKAWSKDHMTDDEFTKQMLETKLKLDELTAELNQITPKENEQVDQKKIKELSKDFVANWAHLPPHDKKQFMATFVESVEIEKKEGKAFVNGVHYF